MLAGGLATRLGGVAKGLLRTGSATIAARSVALFEELFGRALIVSNDPAPYLDLGVPVVPDEIADKGAPAGLHAALSAARTDWVFVVGCDMPRLDAGAIRFLWERRGATAVAVKWERGFEGLHAFWSRRCLATVERMVSEGHPSLHALATAVGARILSADEWREVDPLGRSFENANTAADVARLGLAPPLGPPRAR
jgi:molybdopterin-guanine dinucleotide biosynthesis protein A